mgnify:CR=1 FL=1
MDSFNIYNCKSWGHRPKTNDICLFPSVVSHSVFDTPSFKGSPFEAVFLTRQAFRRRLLDLDPGTYCVWVQIDGDETPVLSAGTLRIT